jgi:hypothetical protein
MRYYVLSDQLQGVGKARLQVYMHVLARFDACIALVKAARCAI